VLIRDLILGNTPACEDELRRQLPRLGPLSDPLILCGSNRGGKGRSRAAHSRIEWALGPLRRLSLSFRSRRNCGRAWLFGHARGTFTGATHDQPGKFEQANNGTIFLDELSYASRAHLRPYSPTVG
jgi:transcriptional regulator with AAA-type ATPase domain